MRIEICMAVLPLTVSKKSHYSVMSNGIFVFGSPLGTITKIIMYSFRNP